MDTKCVCINTLSTHIYKYPYTQCIIYYLGRYCIQRLYLYHIYIERLYRLYINRLYISKVKVFVAQSCLTLWDPMDCSPPGSSVHGVYKARILEWVAIFFFQGIFPTQGSNLVLAHCRQNVYHLSHLGILNKGRCYVERLYLYHKYRKII